MEGEERMLSGRNQCGVGETILNGESSVGSGSIEGWGTSGDREEAALRHPGSCQICEQLEGGMGGGRAEGGLEKTPTYVSSCDFFFLFPSSFS